jgi:hypothetical protein
MRERLGSLELPVPLSARIGVTTGEVVAGEGETLVTGDAVNVAARLETAAGPGEILLGLDTYRLVAAAVRAEAVEPLELKGKARPVPAYRLLEVLPDSPAFTRRVDAPFVGRERELGMLPAGAAPARSACAGRRRPRRPALGRADLPRPRRLPPRLRARGGDLPGCDGAPGAARRSSRVCARVSACTEPRSSRPSVQTPKPRRAQTRRSP